MAWQGENRGSIWTGNGTFPVDQRLRHTPDGLRVVSTPIPEIETLRVSTQTWENLTLESGARQLPAGETYELEATVDVRRAVRFGFKLHADYSVVFDVAEGNLDSAALKPVQGKVKLRLLVDRGQLEVFGNDGEVYQSHNVDFDSLPGGDRIELFADGTIQADSLGSTSSARSGASAQSPRSGRLTVIKSVGDRPRSKPRRPPET